MLPKHVEEEIDPVLEKEPTPTLTCGQIEVQLNMKRQDLDKFFDLNRHSTYDGSCFYSSFAINLKRIGNVEGKIWTNNLDHNYLRELTYASNDSLIGEDVQFDHVINNNEDARSIQKDLVCFMRSVISLKTI